MTRRSVIIAEDHGLVRAGLVAMLEEEAGVEIVGAVTDGEEALACIRRLGPDVALVGLSLPRLSGIEVALRVREAGLRTAVVIVSVHHEPELVGAALDAGAAGYVIKEAAPRELVDAVMAAAAGELYLSPGLGRVVSDALRPPGSAPGAQLTERERAVLGLLASGLGSKEVAARLEIGVRTVDGHRAAIMEKLGIRTIAGLVKYALKHHLTTLED